MPFYAACLHGRSAAPAVLIWSCFSQREPVEIGPVSNVSSRKGLLSLSCLLPGGLRLNGSVQAEFQQHHRPSAHGPGWDSAHEAAGSGLWSRRGLLRGEEVVAGKSK